MAVPDDILWRPSADLIRNSNLTKFQKWLTQTRGLTLGDYTALWQWSVSEIELFWESIAEFYEVKFHSDYNAVLVDPSMPGRGWFSGGTLNYAEHIFRNKTAKHPALYFENELGGGSLSWDELEIQVSAFQTFLLDHGVTCGDRVVGYLPNSPVAIIAFLAANSIGAIWSCCSPDFGVSTVVERFSQIEPVILIACQGYHYGGKTFDRTDEVRSIHDQISSIKTVVVDASLSLPLDDGTYRWQDVMLDAESDALLRFTPVAFEHPIWILYSSGTTGKPKAITHSHGGVLLELLKYLSLQNDVRPGERFFWFTTTGWMMWNFLQASMLVGGVPVLYDGSPGYPNLTKLWSLCEDLGIHHFGTSAPFLIACMNQELAVSDEMDLSTLRTIGSTGAPLPAEAFRWVYQHVKRDVWLCSMSGGTDVCTAFVGSSPSLPVRVGRIQARALGCALEAYGTDQQPVVDELGEMVILQPMPSMPIYFWNDPGGSRFHTSYFDVYPGIWRHGDWIEIASDGSLVIHGRSDATLNRNGIRIGTAEIYSVLDSIDEVSDSLIINVEQPNGGDYMPLFIVMDDTAEMTSDLKKRIKQTLRTQCSPRHIPDDILVCDDIPYTLSGKKMEVPIKRMFMHRDAAPTIQRDAMRNPEAIDWFVSYVSKFYHKG